MRTMRISCGTWTINCPTRRAAPCRTGRHVSQKTVVVRGTTVPFDGAFLKVLQQSLERESREMSEQIGVAGLQIRQAIEGGGSAPQVVFACDFELAKFLRANMGATGELKGAKVLELGCNTGIVGITAAACGASVLITDQVQDLELAKSNIAINEEVIAKEGGSVSAAALSWSQPDEAILKNNWDFVFGSDLMCDEQDLVKIAGILSKIMYNYPKCRAKLAHVHRSDSLDEAMFKALEEADLILTRVGGSGGDGPDVSVFKIARSGQDLSK